MPKTTRQPETPNTQALRAAFDEVFAAQRRLRGRDAKMLDGVSFAQLRVLRAIDRDGPASARRLAERLGISGASTTQLLDVLEQRGLVARTRDDEDRRVVNVDLTADGRRRSRAHQARHQHVFDALFSDLEPDEVTVGTDVLRRCAEYLDAL